MQLSPRTTAPVLLALLALPLVAVAAQDGSGTTPGKTGTAAAGSEVFIDPRADRILWSMSQHLASATAFRVHIETLEDEPHPSGQWVQISTESDLAVHRTRGIRASERGDLEDVEFWTDLKTAAMLDPESGLYALVEVPGTLDAAIDHLIHEYGVTWPLADMAYADPYVGLIENVQVGSYVGLHKAGGVDCHHLAFRSRTVDWQVWVDAGVEPVPRKVVIQYNGVEGAPGYTALLSGWDLDPHLPEVLFQFVAPEGAVQIEVESIRGE